MIVLIQFQEIDESIFIPKQRIGVLEITKEAKYLEKLQRSL